MSQGIYKILNDEGVLCYVDTASKDKNTYGKVWAAICKSKLDGIILEASIDRFQYITNNGEPTESNPVGMIVKIQNEVEAFLPFSNSKDYFDSSADYSGQRIAVVIESFDPMSLSIVVNELKVHGSDFDIDSINKLIDQIGKGERNGTIFEASIDRFQYKTNNEQHKDTIPVGVIVKIQNQIEAFLPFTNSRDYLDTNTDYSGQRIAVMIESFDPKSLNIVVNEIRVTDSDFDLKKINKAIELIGKAKQEGKYVRGTVTGEVITYSTGKRSGYVVSINGIEAYLACSETFFPYVNDSNEIIGHNILASIKNICIEKMSIALTMKTPYEQLIQNLKIPDLNENTRGLVCWVTPYNVYVLLPAQIIGVIPTRLYQSRNYADWLSLTGSLIECIPFRKRHWNTNTNNCQYLIALQNQE